MRDRLWIVAGLAVFVAALTLPPGMRSRTQRPRARRPTRVACESERMRCAAGTMRAAHMKMLIQWREDVVRHGDRRFVAFNARSTRKVSHTPARLSQQTAILRSCTRIPVSPLRIAGIATGSGIDREEHSMRITRKDFLRLSGFRSSRQDADRRCNPPPSPRWNGAPRRRTLHAGYGDRSRQMPREGRLQRLRSRLQHCTQHSADCQPRARSEMDLDRAYATVFPSVQSTTPRNPSRRQLSVALQPLRQAPVRAFAPRRPLEARRRIVMMDWHRCIGCRYCIAACPMARAALTLKIRGPTSLHQPDFPRAPRRSRKV